MPGCANHIHARIRALCRNDEASQTSLGLHSVKTKAIVATLLVAAAASADARFAWPYPPKAVSPDEIGHWVVINGNAWSHDSAESELTTWNTRRGEASPCRRGGRTGPAKNRLQVRKKVPHVLERSPWCRAQESREIFHVL